MTTHRWTWPCVLVPLLAGMVAADPPAGLVTFQRHLDVGTSCVFDRVVQMEVKSTDQSNNGPVQQRASQVSVHLQGRLTLTAVQDGRPSAVRIDFATDNESSVALAGSPVEHVPFPFNGRTVNIQRLPDGQISSDFKGNAPADAVQELGSFLVLDGGVVPAQSVAIGQEWDADADSARSALQLGKDDHGSIHCKLIEVKDDPAGRVAVVEATLTQNMHPVPTGSSKMVLKGNVTVLLSTGLAVDQQFTGQLDLQSVHVQRGPNGNPMEVHTHGVGDVKQSQVVRPDSAADAGPDALLGTFKDDTLSVQLDRAALGGYTGVIRFKGQAFALEAKGSASALKGTFQSQGHAFAFTAALEADTLTFTTETTVYHLRRIGLGPRP